MDKTSDDTKSRIMAAALEEFSAHGLSGARVDKIGKVAGVNKAMIYYYFNIATSRTSQT